MDGQDKAPASSAGSPKLDEVMMAMDVVDTIRHQDTIVARELGREERDSALKLRLREIYRSQGLEVSDRVLNQGIEALRESRFVYTKRGSGLARLLALMWINRGAVGIGVAVVLVLIAVGIGWSGWQRQAAERAVAEARIELTETLPAALETAGEAALLEARDIAAVAEAERHLADGTAALARQDAAGARDAVAALETLRADLLRAYDLRIVSRPGERTGVFRIPDANPNARNYYLIVEAVTPSGETLSLPVTSEEDGTTATVAKWGVRVPRATYDAVAADKQADGIVDDDRLGEKRRGYLAEDYLMDVEDGRIRSW